MKPGDKVLFEDQWLSLMQTEDGYTYAHMSRAEKGQLVACLVYKKDDTGKVTHFLGRYENTPPHNDGLTLSSITGGVDEGQWHLPAILIELVEEAGIPEDIVYGDVQDALKDDVHRMERLEYLGHCFVSKQEDTMAHLYAFDATGLELNKATSDGSKGEEDAYCQWEEPHVVLGCKCPLVSCMAVRSGLLWKI